MNTTLTPQSPQVPELVDQAEPLFSRVERTAWFVAIAVSVILLAVVLAIHQWPSANTTNAAACHDASALMAGKDIAAKLAADGAKASDPSIRRGAALVGATWNGGSGTVYFQGLTEVTDACQGLGQLSS
jgi:hypothetical protein